VRLKIRTYIVSSILEKSATESYVCVEVANHSHFPVTIKDVAFTLRRYPTGKTLDRRRKCSDGSRLPRRLESRDSIQVLFPYADDIAGMLSEYETATVETACGRVERWDMSDLRRSFQPAERTHGTRPVI
jgi:hypothetical protein